MRFPLIVLSILLPIGALAANRCQLLVAQEYRETKNVIYNVGSEDEPSKVDFDTLDCDYFFRKIDGGEEEAKELGASILSCKTYTEAGKKDSLANQFEIYGRDFGVLTIQDGSKESDKYHLSFHCNKAVFEPVG